jgi:hypothetical protein
MPMDLKEDISGWAGPPIFLCSGACGVASRFASNDLGAMMVKGRYTGAPAALAFVNGEIIKDISNIKNSAKAALLR